MMSIGNDGCISALKYSFRLNYGTFFFLLEREFPNIGKLSKGTLTTTPLEQRNAITKDTGTALN